MTTLLIVLTVTVAAVMSCHALLAALGDVRGAQFALGAGLICLVALSVDVLLLVGALGWQAMHAADDATSDR